MLTPLLARAAAQPVPEPLDGNGGLCASLRTSDCQGPYHSSVCLIDGEPKRQTWAEHRNFLFNWEAELARP